MDVQSRKWACFTGVCLALILFAAYALDKNYVCMGMQRGQIATVAANSVEAAVKIAKSSWGAAGCYKK
jgi:acyl-homoserine lactone acylase PvdQ